MTRRILHCAVTAWLLTAWLAAAAFSAEPLRFSVAADSRGTAGFVDVMKQLQAAGGPGAFVLTPGDMDPAKTTREQLDKALGSGVAWYPVVGNHEVDSKETMAYLRDYFNSRLKGKVAPGPQGTQQTTYSFDAGDVHIAVIDTYWDGKADSSGDARAKTVAPALLAWLEKDLKASNKPWKLVAGHEPAFPQPDKQWDNARHIGDSLDRDKPSRDAFWKMLEDQGVAVYLCGHTHRYSRYQPPGSKVWQIDAAQARADKDWKYDAFILVTADKGSLKFDVYRNLKEQGKFSVIDTLTIPGK
jgi:hypothetical protein